MSKVDDIAIQHETATANRYYNLCRIMQSWSEKKGGWEGRVGVRGGSK